MKFCHMYDIEVDYSYRREIGFYLFRSAGYFCLDWRNYSVFLFIWQPNSLGIFTYSCNERVVFIINVKDFFLEKSHKNVN